MPIYYDAPDTVCALHNLIRQSFSGCNCNKEGSTNIACNQRTGACTCIAGFYGDKCQGKFQYCQYPSIGTSLNQLIDMTVGKEAISS